LSSLHFARELHIAVSIDTNKKRVAPEAPGPHALDELT